MLGLVCAGEDFKAANARAGNLLMERDGWHNESGEEGEQNGGGEPWAEGAQAAMGASGEEEEEGKWRRGRGRGRERCNKSQY